jgi:PAP2 superfamily
MKKLVSLIVVVAGLVAPAVAKADVVTAWNRTMVTGLEAAHVGPQPSSRIGAIVETSVFDAVNGIERRYTPFHVTPDAPPGASRAAAAASAAYTALVALIPSQQSLFDQQLQSTLAQISDDPADPGQSVLRGLDWGHGVANAVLAWRANDGLNAVLPPYVFGTSPGDYQPTPPLFGPPLFRQYATMTPWALTAPSQFLPAGPPSLTSAGWAQDLAEVQAYGSATSTVRTAWETETARFWQSDTPVAMWNRVADDLAESHDTTLSQNARLLALTNIAMADAMIATFNAKNTYNFWRPVTAIAATGDPTWSPLLPTPAFQEYPSAHSTVSAAPATVLAEFYGDETPFTLTSANMPGVTRDFISFTEAVQQVESARVWAGFHFRFSCEDGATLGTNVANWVLATLALPVRGNETGQLRG